MDLKRISEKFDTHLLLEIIMKRLIELHTMPKCYFIHIYIYILLNGKVYFIF